MLPIDIEGIVGGAVRDVIDGFLDTIWRPFLTLLLEAIGALYSAPDNSALMPTSIRYPPLVRALCSQQADKRNR